jgi:hypothetical protein
VAAQLAADSEGGAPVLPAVVTRLSAERLPPVMYNTISEESSPYASINHTPFSSSASLQRAAGGSASGSGNLAPWLPPVPEHPCSLRSQQEQQHVGFSGVSVALKLQGGGVGLHAQSGSGGKGGLGGLEASGGGPAALFELPSRPSLFGPGGSRLGSAAGV